jgi:hypothetical protein
LIVTLEAFSVFKLIYKIKPICKIAAKYGSLNNLMYPRYALTKFWAFPLLIAIRQAHFTKVSWK